MMILRNSVVSLK